MSLEAVEKRLAWGEWLLNEGRAGEAKVQFDLALVRDPDAAKQIANAYLASGRKQLSEGKDASLRPGDLDVKDPQHGRVASKVSS